MRYVAIIILLAVLTAPVFALTQAQTVVLAGQALAGSDTLGNAKVVVTLVGTTCWSSTDIMPSMSKTVYANSAGNWSITLVGSDSITCVSGFTDTYTVEVIHPVLDLSGTKIKYEGLVIPATNGATTQLRTLVSQQ